MTKLFSALPVLGLFFLISCTSEESKIKEAAIDGAKDRFQAELREEQSKVVTGKDNLQRTAVNILTEKTEFTVAELNHQATSGEAVVKAATIPKKAKVALFEIMSRLGVNEAGRFNVPDALNLIYPQVGLARGETEEVTYKVKLQKGTEWHAVKEKSE